MGRKQNGKWEHAVDMRSQEVVAARLTKMGTKAPDKMLSRMAYVAELQAILEPARVEPRFKTKRDCDESTFNGSAGYCQACYARELRRRHRPKQRTCAVFFAKRASSRLAPMRGFARTHVGKRSIAVALRKNVVAPCYYA